MEVIIVQILIAIATIGSAWGIVHYQIKEGHKFNTQNLKVNAENAGKNRTIYGVEVMRENDKSNLKIKLESRNYTILNAYADPASLTNNTVVVLGKIKP